MTVYEIHKNKFKIKLSDTEVLALFGSYTKLFEMKKETKILINLLLKDILSKRKQNFKNGKISADLKVIKNFGCEIYIVCSEAIEIKTTAFRFKSFENLINGIKALKETKFESSLYKYNGFYYLMADNENLSYLINDFYSYKTRSYIFLEKVKEYGKMIIEENAAQILAETFN
ncbi:MAG: adaptor protein MecA [Clostridia bacterium]|nr:adaptor protein MecA [Clostridia bacterium]